MEEPSTPKKYKVVCLVAVVLLGMALLYIAHRELGMGRIGRVIDAKQASLIYRIDHGALASCARASVWPADTAVDPLAVGLYNKGDARVPDALWIAKASRILVAEDRVRMEYGGALLHYGIAIFPKGQIGEGTRMLADGVWFYSDNGRYPEALVE
jgi:hypothetical protein